MRATLSRLFSTILTSRTLRSLRRTRHALGRVFGGKATVHYFHQDDDPYSQLTAQMLEPLAQAYRIEIKSHQVSPPDNAAAPERERLAKLALEDAALLARAYGLKFPAPEAKPQTIEQDGDALRKRLGHYLGAMLYFEGEWYWGVDRLHFLEERLHAAGLGETKGPFKPIAAVKDVTFAPAKPTGATLDYFLSFRSPYTYLAVPRMRRLADHYGAKLRLRFVLPMVMRGLPVPAPKRLYILLDTKREAERLGMPFGTVVDPVGKGAERGLAVLHHAIQARKGPEFVESFLRGVFAEGIDAASNAGLNKLAQRAGLDRDLVTRALKDESWRKVAEANREELFALGLWGVPSFRVNQNRPHWGQDRLWAIEQELQQA